jgi:hypothetical protein
MGEGERPSGYVEALANNLSRGQSENRSGTAGAVGEVEGSEEEGDVIRGNTPAPSEVGFLFVQKKTVGSLLPPVRGDASQLERTTGKTLRVRKPKDDRCSHLLHIDAELLRQSMDGQHRSAEEVRKLAREMRDRAVKMRVESESARRVRHNWVP